MEDAAGRMLTMKDALNGITSYKYDALGRVLTVTDPLSGVAITEYDGNGNVAECRHSERNRHEGKCQDTEQWF